MNNGGGRIFSLLASGISRSIDELFVTPHDADLGALVRAAGAAHVRVEAAGTICPASSATRPPGLRVVEVVVDPELDRRVRERACARRSTAALAPTWP